MTATISPFSVDVSAHTLALARTGRRTTRLGYGCSSLMGAMGRRESGAILEAAYDAGIRHFDVAPVYGYGAAESCVGEFRRRHTDITITTKYGIAPAKNQSLLGFARKFARPLLKAVPALKQRMASAAASVSTPVARPLFTAEAARASLEQSLRALETERIDVWLLHEAQADDLTDEDLLRLLEDSRREGTIGDFGIGSEAARVAELLRERPEYCPVVQYEWSAIDPVIEDSGVFRMHHRALTDNFRNIHNSLLHDREKCNEWSRQTGVDLVQAETLAMLMLKAAFVFNPESVVLVSSKNPKHLRANMDVLHDTTLAVPAQRLHQLLQSGSAQKKDKRMNRWKRWRTSILLMLAVLGPGFITANVDNDAGGIYTYATAGAQFGYALLWTMIPMTVLLAFAQEIATRMGVVTGKGLSELIREEYGLRVTAILMAALVVCNLGNVISEFAGVASSASLFNISPFVSVPLAAVMVWALVVYGNYKSLEKIFVFLSFLYIAYIITAALAHPNWSFALKDTLRVPRMQDLKNPGYLYLSVGIIGATVAPWQQFYLQASVVDKGARRSQLKLAQTDAIVGSVFSVIVAAFIVIACAATLFVGGIHNINDAADAAQSLRPLGGKYASLLFAFGLLNASLFAASILPLSTAYTVCEAMGFESGLDKKFREAPAFYWLYTGSLVIGAAVILVSKTPPPVLAVLSQVLNCVLLPFVLVFMLLLANKRGLMGNAKNNRWYAGISWMLTAAVALLVLLWLWQTAHGAS